MARLKAPWREVPAAVARLDPALFSSADDVRAVLQVRTGGRLVVHGQWLEVPEWASLDVRWASRLV